jgi:hypothetical protein
MRQERHGERSEAIHLAARTEWIASSLLLLAMTAVSVIEPLISFMPFGPMLSSLHLITTDVFYIIVTGKYITYAARHVRLV